MKDSQGQILGDCSWTQKAPLWQSASEAVVLQSEEGLVRVLLNKTLQGGPWTLVTSIFYRFELPALARHPPKGGLRILNENPAVKCKHLVPFIRGRIEETGVPETWKQVGSFSCLDIPGLLGEEEAHRMDARATPFQKPGFRVRDECQLRNKALTWELFQACLSQGEVEWHDLQQVAARFGVFDPTSSGEEALRLRVSRLLEEYGPQVAVAIPDLMRMFDIKVLEGLIAMEEDITHSDGKVADRAFAAMGAGVQHLGHPDLEKLLNARFFPAHVLLKVVQGLAALGKRDPGLVLASLALAMKNDDADVREAAVQAVVGMGTADPTWVLPALAKTLGDARLGAAQFGDARLDVAQLILLALPALPELASGCMLELSSLQALQAVAADANSNWQVRAPAVKALGLACTKDLNLVLPILDKAVSDVSSQVRLSAVEALDSLAARGGEKTSIVPLLQRALKDRHSKVYGAALRAIAHHGSPHPNT